METSGFGTRSVTTTSAQARVRKHGATHVWRGAQIYIIADDGQTARRCCTLITSGSTTRPCPTSLKTPACTPCQHAREPHANRQTPPGFQVVARPKRFFAVGRIFKAVWSEPDGAGAAGSPSAPRAAPVGRTRWFIVVRRQQHHSLCFRITTFKGDGGRPADYAVLHSSAVAPARPYEEEGITRDPVGVIIENGEQYISPVARLDCGRVYTVQDSLGVMKIGRVHPTWLPLLDEYYRESVS
ncbi:hypothetical protein BT67DRAFT_442918 [Trichocladium antarcticum]|uniref:DUF6590 domain-containing protein n=1 Tax=Trichocladium antarcticum TaxID=1450529 RepID=A0AAN6ZD43_9PEZI|nr:hypothetical protein BT67DRAFT_442918 [Trichocladium antarcticum]